jgi:hypothetical protein
MILPSLLILIAIFLPLGSSLSEAKILTWSAAFSSNGTQLHAETEMLT